MPIKLARIEVDSLGPLSSFNEDLADVTLIYGQNETGKTFLVEFILKSLFQSWTAFPKSEFRVGKPKGKVLVSGLEKELVTFSPAQKSKLETKWGDSGRRMPTNIARLLVVKAGDLSMSGESGSAIGLDTIREIFSSEAILQEIQKGILDGTRQARIEEGQILGSRSGDLGRRGAAEKEVGNTTELLERVDRQLADGDVVALRKKIADLDGRVQGLEKAKRYAAYRLSQDMQKLQTEIDRFGDADLDKTESTSKDLIRSQAASAAKQRERAEADRRGQHFPWLNAAVQQYQAYPLQVPAVRINVQGILAIVAFIGAIVLGAANQTWPSIAAIIVGIALGLWYFQLARQHQADRPKREELEKLRATYQERFGESCKDLATMRVKLDEIAADFHAGQQIDKEIAVLQNDISRLEVEIEQGLKALGHIKVPSNLWTETIADSRNALRGLQRSYAELDQDRLRLDVDPADYVHEDPGIQYERTALDQARSEKQKVEADLISTEQSLQGLRSEVQAVVGEHTLTDWESLIQRLRDLRFEKLNLYKGITSTIIAGNLMNRVIEQNLTQENEKVLENLDSSFVKQPLVEITKHYVSLDLRDDAIVAIDEDNQEFALSTLSTGAREQIMLALRIGFAKQVLQGDTGFLILDDAFQHSDWQRRPRLVDAVLQMAQQGWQVIYFAMDDHIRGLFDARAKKLPKNRYKRIDL